MEALFSNKEHEKALLDKIRSGDAHAFELVFRRYYPHLVMFAKRYMVDKDLSENVVQGVFVKMWEKRRTQIIKSLQGFLVVAVRNQCHNELKHQGVVNQYEHYAKASTPVEWPVFEENVYLDKINEAIETLPEQRKRIFKMSRMEGLKYKEIADQLGISQKTVEGQMGKALKYLR